MNKKGIAIETIAYFIIALVVVFVVIFGFTDVKNKALSAFDKILESVGFESISYELMKESEKGELACKDSENGKKIAQKDLDKLKTSYENCKKGTDCDFTIQKYESFLTNYKCIETSVPLINAKCHLIYMYNQLEKTDFNKNQIAKYYTTFMANKGSIGQIKEDECKEEKLKELYSKIEGAKSVESKITDQKIYLDGMKFIQEAIKTKDYNQAMIYFIKHKSEFVIEQYKSAVNFWIIYIEYIKNNQKCDTNILNTFSNFLTSIDRTIKFPEGSKIDNIDYTKTYIYYVTKYLQAKCWVNKNDAQAYKIYDDLLKTYFGEEGIYSINIKDVYREKCAFVVNVDSCTEQNQEKGKGLFRCYWNWKDQKCLPCADFTKYSCDSYTTTYLSAQMYSTAIQFCNEDLCNFASNFKKCEWKGQSTGEPIGETGFCNEVDKK